LAHFAEIQVGLAVSTSRLCFFALAGLVVAAGGQDPDDAPAAAPGPRPALLGALVAMVLVALTFAFEQPDTTLAQALPRVLIGGGVWLFGAALLSTEPPGAAPRRGPALLFEYTCASLGLWLLFASVYAPWIAALAQPQVLADPARAIARQLADAVGLLYAAAVAWIALVAGALAWPRLRAPRPVLSLRAAMAAPPLLGLAAILMVAEIARVRADVYAKVGNGLERHARWEAAASAHAGAFAQAPGEDRYAANLARVLMEQARDAARHDRPAAERRLARADELVAVAQRLSPLDPDHPTNQARLHRLWAAVALPEDRPHHLETALAAYERALALRPHHAGLWNEVALLQVARGRRNDAWRAFERSLALDAGYATTYLLRAELRAQAGDVAAAVADYERALALDSTSPLAQEDRARARAALQSSGDAGNRNPPAGP
jgi:tetratricopeptide (TPR) repeat protein